MNTISNEQSEQRIKQKIDDQTTGHANEWCMMMTAGQLLSPIPPVCPRSHLSIIDTGNTIKFPLKNKIKNVKYIYTLTNCTSFQFVLDLICPSWSHSRLNLPVCAHSCSFLLLCAQCCPSVLVLRGEPSMSPVGVCGEAEDVGDIDSFMLVRPCMLWFVPICACSTLCALGLCPFTLICVCLALRALNSHSFDLGSGMFAPVSRLFTVIHPCFDAQVGPPTNAC